MSSESGSGNNRRGPSRTEGGGRPKGASGGSKGSSPGSGGRPRGGSSGGGPGGGRPRGGAPGGGPGGGRPRGGAPAGRPGAGRRDSQGFGSGGRGRGRSRDSDQRDEISTRAAVKARAIAAERLQELESSEAYIGHLPPSEKNTAEIDRQVTDYLSGVTRWKRLLDRMIVGAYHGDYERMEPLLRQVLRIGTYDLHIRKRAPHAAVHEAVGAAGAIVRKGATGLTNAVLRAVSQLEIDATLQSIEDPVERLAVRWSHPTWMVRRWIGRFGEEETKRLMMINNHAPRFGLRIAGPPVARSSFESLLTDIGMEYERSPYLPDFLRVKRLQPIVRAKWIERGYCAVHDESTGLVVRLLDPKAGEHIVDACAAPGGKTLYIAEQMNGEGSITAIDVAEVRSRLLDSVVERTKTAVEIVTADFAEWAKEHPDSCDRLLLDTPCSGLGVIGRRADLRWRRGPEQFAELNAVQDRLLDAAATVVKPGGLLVYATCSIAPEENHERIDAFLSRNTGFQLETAAELLPAQVVDDRGFLVTLPQKHGVDGAFGARLRRTAAATE